MRDLRSLDKIIISRTDSIGDVILTLPLAGLLKTVLAPQTKVAFLGRTYTRPVINSSSYVDEFLNYDTFAELDAKGRAGFLKDTGAGAIIHVFPRAEVAAAARDARIRIRIGTTNRLYHWFTCNKLVLLSRKNSRLHEAQLNTILLRPLGHRGIPDTTLLGTLFGMNRMHELPAAWKSRLSPGKFNLIIHPKSQSSAREWSLNHFSELLRRLPPDRFQVFITGTAAEKEALGLWLYELPAHAMDLTGAMNLEELLAFIQHADGLVASSTGPLHMAAAMGIHALGLFPPIRPMDPGRWAPLGPRAEFLVMKKDCSDCRRTPKSCHCMNEIVPAQVAGRVLKWAEEKGR